MDTIAACYIVTYNLHILCLVVISEKTSLYIPKCMNRYMSPCLAQQFCTRAVNHKVPGSNLTLEPLFLNMYFLFNVFQVTKLEAQNINCIKISSDYSEYLVRF